MKRNETKSHMSSVKKNAGSDNNVANVTVSSASPVGKTSVKSDQVSSGSSCCSCNMNITDDVKALQCDRCMSPKAWKCASCLNISDELYEKLVSDPKLNLKWFCDSCDNIISEKTHSTAQSHSDKLDQLIIAIEKLMERYDNIDQRLANKCDTSEMVKLETRINLLEHQAFKYEENNRELETMIKENQQKVNDMQTTMSETTIILNDVQDELKTKSESTQWSDIVKEAVDSKFETVSVGLNIVEKSIEETRKQAQEIKDKEDRRNNVILYKVPECPPGSYEEIIKHDGDFFLEACTQVLGLDITRDDIKKIYRIGKRGPEARPLLVQLSSGMLKNHVMETTYRLRTVDKFKGIVISHDMTKSEREHCKQLVAEAKTRESQETSGEFIFRVRGPPGNMKVVRLRKRM